MSKVFSVKSNARRAARAQGLDPDLVVAVEGGFVIGEPPAPPAPEPPAAEPPALKTSGVRAGTAQASLLEALLQGWVTAAALMERFRWQAHTLRGAISTLKATSGHAIERQRVDGVTSYRALV